MKALLAAMGDANDPATWSGIPYHFLQASRRAGLVHEGLALRASGPRVRLDRWAWNATRPLHLSRLGGYQYSTTFLERLWRPVAEQVRGAAVINTFQLTPPSIVVDDRVETWMFIDQTLRQLFDDYGQSAVVGRAVREDALAREARGYRNAAGVVVHSEWAARSVREDYGVDKAKIHVAVPGANLASPEYAAWDRAARPPQEHDGLRLVFVGVEWRRKGLDRLLLALALARAAGAPVTLRVIGCDAEAMPPELAKTPGVEWSGRIDKRADPGRFLRLIAECDMGCLLSRAEAGGISLREFHALGLPTLATTVGGAPEHAIADASIPVAPDDAPEAIADILAGLARSPTALATLRRRAFAARHQATWESTIDRFMRFWPREGIPT